MAVGRDWERGHGGEDILVCGHLNTYDKPLSLAVPDSALRWWTES